ncbi:hypothetical protein scyTo_0004374 [Scyliorhinus torazame]|uniref:Uncharacterized protein n=1 Tax=Scyliorhinus torazame TaxID=75743 RepID=A0A401NQS7_SCYTO|nr:hypothetical protein [Scyliorhinus torazame]
MKGSHNVTVPSAEETLSLMVLLVELVSDPYIMQLMTSSYEVRAFKKTVYKSTLAVKFMKSAVRCSSGILPGITHNELRIFQEEKLAKKASCEIYSF